MAARGLYTAVRQQTRLNGQIITYVCVLVIFKKIYPWHKRQQIGRHFIAKAVNKLATLRAQMTGMEVQANMYQQLIFFLYQQLKLL